MIKFKLSTYSNRQIARELNFNRNTINGYVQKIKKSDKTLQQLYDLSDGHLRSMFEKEKQPPDRLNEPVLYFTRIAKERSRPGFTFQNIWQ